MLDELVADILTDFTDEDGNPLAPSEYIRRQAERALSIIGVDLDVDYRLDNDDVVPEMPEGHRELWALRSKIFLCRHFRAQAASRVSFSSGDKKMDRSREAANWAALEKDLVAEYKAAVRLINPDADETLITPNIRPSIYERGSALE